jgi:hypothetical protein
MESRTQIIIVSIVIILLIAAGSYSLFFNDSSTPTENKDTTSLNAESEPEPIVPQTTQVTAEMRGYENRDFRFGLLYPQNLSVREYKEQGGALSVIFEDPSDGKGFQIYVTPYGDGQITKERFQMDVSSGVMKEPTDVMVGGVRGTMFLSTHSLMGETREVWFINNGFLYEVVTYKQLDEWLSGIMQTWQFI